MSSSKYRPSQEVNVLAILLRGVPPKYEPCQKLTGFTIRTRVVRLQIMTPDFRSHAKNDLPGTHDAHLHFLFLSIH